MSPSGDAAPASKINTVIAERRVLPAQRTPDAYFAAYAECHALLLESNDAA